MMELYQKIKGWLTNPDMLHVLYSYLIANIIACGFIAIDTYDKFLIISGSWALTIMFGVFIESMDGRQGTKQLDETGVPGNSFSVKDLVYDIVGATLGAITIACLI